MPKVAFTPNLRRHLDARPLEVEGDTVVAVLEHVFDLLPELRGYLLDDQGRLRRHVALYVDGQHIRDTARLLDPVGPASEIYVIQALSGG